MAGFEPIRFGKYQLIEKIATGGMAEVYKAKSYGVAGFEKLLVIKKILPHLSRNPSFVRMFINEAKIAVSLNHANVVQVYDLGVVDADYYMAMEFIHGQDLMQIIKVGRKRKRYLPIPTGVFVVTEMVRGLDYAHNLCDPGGRPLNVVHQDVSPHNVLISYQGDVKLVDFGIARVGEVAEEEAGRVAGGKFAYMSPEQVARGEIDARSDLFSTGVILYELITGHRLFKGRGGRDKREQVQAAEIPRPRDVNPEIPVRLEEIVLQALARDPQDRYQEARVLQEDLQSFLYDMGLQVTRALLADFMQEMFTEDYKRSTAGSVVNAIVQDLQELSRQPSTPPVGLGDLTASRSEISEASRSLERSFSGLSSTTDHTPPLGVGMARGERRQVVVLAAEILGLSEVAEELGEDALLRLNFSLLKRLASLVKRYRGTLARVDSDRLMVFWGLEKRSSRDLELALRCVAELQGMAKDFARKRGAPTRLAVGVHRGPLLVPGDRAGRRRRRRRTYTPWGDTLKLARRLCEAAEPGEVLLSERVYSHVREWGEFEAVEPLQAKWSKRPVLAYRFVRLDGEGERDAAGNWVRRGSEFDVLGEAIGRVGLGQASVLAIEGEAGSGKARFIREIRSLLTKEHDLAFYSGKSVFYRGGIPLLPFREIVEQVCGFAEGDTDTEWTAKLLQLQELQLDPIDVHLLGQLVGLQFPESNLRYLSGDQVLVGTFQAVRKLIGGLCRDRFVVLALENFEYVDAYSAELAAELLRSLKDDRLLLVVTQPTGSALPFPEDQPLDRVELPPMGKKECEGFISGLLGVHSVPRPLVDLVYKSSGGNALFAKEILGQLLQEGKIRVEVESVVVEGKLSRAGIPATASDLIASRIDALNADQRLVLESAAVVGRSFSQALLSEVVQLDAEAIVPVLSALADLKLVRSAREEDQLGPDVHVFRNDLSWEVCIRGLLDARARELHNRIGEAIERVYAKGLSPYFEELSRHYEAGGLHRRAASFAEQAGQTFARQYYNREALRCFQRAIHLLQTAPTSPSEERAVSAHLSDLYLRIGKIHSREIKNPEAERSYMLALDYAGEAEDASLTAQALVKVAESQVELGKLDAAGPYLSQALAEAKRLGDTALYIDASEERARWAIRGGDFELCGTVLAEALELAQSLGDLNRVARVHDLLGDFAMRTGAFERSLEHLRSGRDAALKTEDRILQGRLMNNLGVAYVHSGQLEDALRCYERACELRQDIEYRRGVIINLHNIGDVLLRQGEMERAYQYFDESLELARALGWLGGQAMNQVYLGFLQEWRGEEGGTLVLEEAIEDAKTSGVSDAVAQGKVFLARLAERRGDQELCDSLLVEAETLGTSGLVDLGAWNALSAEANGGSPGHRPPDPVA